MRLFGYELKKLLSRQYLIFFFLLYLFLNAFHIYTNHDLFLTPELHMSASGERVSYDKMQLAFNQAYFGEINSEKVNQLAAHIEKAKKAKEKTGNAPWNAGYYNLPGGDLLQGQQMLEEMERLYNYDQRIAAPVLKRNAELKAMAKNDYAVRLCERIESAFSGRQIAEYYRMNQYRPLLSYKLSSLLLILIGAYAAAGLFAQEREAKMLLLQKSATKGTKKLFFVKIAVLWSFIFAASFLFFAEDLALFSACRRPSGLHLPIWSINDIVGNYEYSPLNISIAGFLLLLWLVRALGAFTISMLAVLFSTLLRRSFLAFLAALPCVAALMGLTLFTDGIFSAIRYGNPVTLLIYPRLVENFIVENIFGLPIFAHELAPLGTAALLALLILLSYLVYRRRGSYA